MKRTLRTEQTGMVAIIVTMIMMFVITLIVIGFSEVTRRNQREALDSQLATQAYYAAETGVNDVVNLISNQNADIQTMGTTGCSLGTYGGVSYPRPLKGTDVVNTCLTIDPNPTSLLADTIEQSTDTIVWNVQTTSGNPFSSLTFKWSPDPSIASGTCPSAFNSYPRATAASWSCKNALLRVDMVPAGGPYDAASLATATKTLYLKPSAASSGALTLGAASAYQAGCVPNAQGVCSVTVNVTGAAYYMRLTTLYATAKSVILTGTEGVSTPARFAEGQVIIDSTGRAQDQVKRIRVRVPLGTPATLPIFAVQGKGTICKNLTTASRTAANPAGVYDLGGCTW